MKQYVLFKFTENFLLSIDGTLENPSYSLQKKSRIQKLFENLAPHHTVDTPQLDGN